MPVTTGIGYSPLTDKVYMGKQNKGKDMWVGDNKKDITNQFLHVSHLYFEKNTIRRISSSKGAALFIHVEENRESVEKMIAYLQKQLKKIKK